MSLYGGLVVLDVMGGAGASDFLLPAPKIIVGLEDAATRAVHPLPQVRLMWLPPNIR